MVASKVELHRHLNQPWRGRAHDMSEVRIVDLSTDCGRAVKLGVVKDIKGFGADIERTLLLEAHGLGRLFKSMSRRLTPSLTHQNFEILAFVVDHSERLHL